MGDIKLSLAIPYKQRLANIEIVFEALAAQTMDRSEFEVVVGVMEYSEEYVALCRAFADRLDIVSVLTSREFGIPHARNLAMRQASGRVVVQMDADTLLPPDALRSLYDRHFRFGQQACVVGQVVGYGNNDCDVDTVEVRPYAHYLDALAELGDTASAPRDPRFQVAHVIPWAFGWTGLIALPAQAVRQNNLYFDEEFHGWGVDDLEWSYRICASGMPITLCADVYGIHLPHTRDRGANQRSETVNFRRFLKKWPGPDVELAHAFGDVEANRLFLDYRGELDRAAGGDGRSLATLRGTIGGTDAAIVGAILDARRTLIDPGLLALFDDRCAVEVWPLAGLGLPFEDGALAECRILPAIEGFSARYRDAVHAETRRVASSVAPMVREPA